MKIPVFFHHIREHKTLTPNISFLEFLTIHYLKDSVNDKDHARDMQLPFKTIDHISTSVIPAFIPESTIMLHTNTSLLTKTRLYIADESFIVIDFVAGIWQPPKQC